jgi:hypothetical protein
MAGAEIARLDRRIDGVDETVRALGDSILDIREVQDRHTALLERLETAMLQMSAQLTEVLRRLPEPE